MVRSDIDYNSKGFWKSKVAKGVSSFDYSIDVSGVKVLELVEHPTNNGTGSDWGLWLGPKLGRQEKLRHLSLGSPCGKYDSSSR